MNKCQGCISENKDNCPVFKMSDIKSLDEWFEILKGEPCPIKILTKEAELKNQTKDYYERKEVKDKAFKEMQEYKLYQKCCGTCKFYLKSNFKSHCGLRGGLNINTFAVKPYGVCKYWNKID